MSIFDGITNIFTKWVSTDYEIENPFNMCITNVDYSKYYGVEIYRRILTDCLNRANGLSEEQKMLFWDSCLTSDVKQGLITILSFAMYNKSTVYIVYKVGVIRTATKEEEAQIDSDPTGKSGIKVDFTNFYKTDLLNIYIALLYNIIATCNTGLNLSKALKVGISKLRETVSNENKEPVIAQIKAINEALKAGKSVALDKEDTVSAVGFDFTSTEKGMEIFTNLIANLLGFPQSYLSGIISGGLNNTGENDTIAVERGLLFYFNSILKPTTDKLLGTNIKFKSDNWRKLLPFKDLLPALEMTTLLTDEEKQEMIEGLK